MSTKNSEQIELWNTTAGQMFVANQERLNRALGPGGRAAMELLEIGSGDRVLDFGCGCSDTDVRTYFTEKADSDGLLRPLSTTWLATARRPD